MIHTTAADPPEALQVPPTARPTHHAEVKAIPCVGMNIRPLLARGRGSAAGGSLVSLLLTRTFRSPVARVGDDLRGNGDPTANWRSACKPDHLQ